MKLLENQIRYLYKCIAVIAISCTFCGIFLMSALWQAEKYNFKIAGLFLFLAMGAELIAFISLGKAAGILKIERSKGKDDDKNS